MADAITVRNLVVCRGRRTILHDFSIGLPKGKVTAIIGPNGCGKSTFLKAVNGMIPVVGGSICSVAATSMIFPERPCRGKSPSSPDP